MQRVENGRVSSPTLLGETHSKATAAVGKAADQNIHRDVPSALPTTYLIPSDHRFMKCGFDANSRERRIDFAKIRTDRLKTKKEELLCMWSQERADTAGM